MYQLQKPPHSSLITDLFLAAHEIGCLFLAAGAYKFLATDGIFLVYLYTSPFTVPEEHRFSFRKYVRVLTKTEIKLSRSPDKHGSWVISRRESNGCLI